ncbi:MAG TPA: anti-sigma factor [Symbiobacteriaceae bacterium]
MNCDGVRGLLSAYLDGELTPGELLRVEQHLRRCPTCADEVDSLRQTIALVASLDEIEVPPSFHPELRKRLVALQPPALQERHKTAAGTWQRRIIRWALPAAAAALAIAFSSLPQVRGMLGLEAPTSRFQVSSNGPDPGTTGTVVSGIIPGTGEKGGKSGPANPASGNGFQDPSGGHDIASLDPGGAVDLPDGTSSQPGSRGTVTGGTSGEARAAGGGFTTPEEPAEWEPMYSYSITMVVSGVSQEQVVSALRDFKPRAESDSILITVPAAQRSAVVSAVRSLPGAQLPVEPAETAVDLAPQIHDMTSRLEADQQQLQSLKEQMASLDDPAALEDAQRLQKALEERIAETSQALDLVKGQVDSALITVRVESGGQ